MDTIKHADILKGRLLLDVREPYEYKARRIPGSVNVPLSRIMVGLDLPKDTPIVTICEHGVRAEKARRVLVAHGYRQVKTLSGGIAAWPGDFERG